MQFSTIPGFPDYLVTDTGIVLSRKVYGSKIGSVGPYWELKPKFYRGYPVVDLWRGKKPHRIGIHRLVALAFIGPCPEGQEVRHLNDIRTDNRLENLAYGTRTQNMEDRRRNGRMPLGENVYNAKLSNEQVREVRRMVACGMKKKDVAKQLKCRYMTVMKIMNGQIYRSVT